MKIVATATLMALTTIGSAKDYALTAYAGYRGGGGFIDANTGQSLNLGGSAAVALALDFPLDDARQYQVLVSHQRTHLSLGTTSSARGNPLPMEITYLHLGGTNFFEGTVGRGPYLVGGLGATLFSPGAGYSGETYPSLNLGIGYQWLLGDTFAVRVEARGYATLVNSSGGIFCSGGCVVSIKGDTVRQGDLMLGVASRF